MIYICPEHGKVNQIEPCCLSAVEVNRVCFRKFKKGGDIIAILPDCPANSGMWLSYMHVGQHGECSKSIISDTTPAQTCEYIQLLTELKSIGYSLRVIRRISK